MDNTQSRVLRAFEHLLTEYARLQFDLEQRTQDDSFRILEEDAVKRKAIEVRGYIPERFHEQAQVVVEAKIGALRRKKKFDEIRNQLLEDAARADELANIRVVKGLDIRVFGVALSRPSPPLSLSVALVVSHAFLVGVLILLVVRMVK